MAVADAMDDYSQEKLIEVISSDEAGPYYGGSINIDTSFIPGYIVSLYLSGKIDAKLLQSYINYTDPNGNLYPSILSQFGATEQYEADLASAEEPPEEPEPKPTLTGDNLGAVYDALIEEGYTDEQARDLIRKYEINPTGQDAVTLEGILQGAGYGVDLLKLPSDPEFQTAVFRDTDGDGYNDTWVNTNPFNDNVIVISEEELNTQQKEELEKANAYKEIKEEPQFDDLEDWQKDKVLIDGGFDPEFGTDGQEPVAPEEPVDPNQSLIDKYGESAVNKSKEIYEGVKGWIEGAIDDPQGTLVNILDNIYSGMPDECKEDTVNKPDDWWKDCTTVSVLLPGLNLPLPPGMIDANATVRDLEDAAKEVGKTLEDIFNGEDDRSITEILGDWANDVWEGIKDAWEDLEDKTDAGLLNVLIDMGYGILGPLIFNQVKDKVIGNTNPLAFVKNCYDPEYVQASPENAAYCEEALDQGAMIQCSDGSYKESETECSDYEKPTCDDPLRNELPSGECGGCIDGYEPDSFGDCIETTVEEPCGDGEVRNDITGLCEEEEFFEEGAPCKVNGKSGTFNADGDCIEDVIVEPTPCANNATLESECQQCEDGSLPSEHVNNDCLEEIIVEPTPCANNATLESECQQCEDGSLPSEHVNNDCLEDKIVVPIECPEGTPKAGQMVNSLDDCGTDPVLVECPEGTPKAGQMVNTLDDCGTTTETCANGATDYPLCTECPDGSSTDPETPCGSTPTETCANGATNYPACTECPDGSSTDFETPCSSTPTETCANGAIDYPLCSECANGSAAGEAGCAGGGCPEGQAPCASLGGECTTPEECPGSEGGSSGGGGGGGGMFSPTNPAFGSLGDPELLKRAEFPITDFLSGIFTGR